MGSYNWTANLTRHLFENPCFIIMSAEKNLKTALKQAEKAIIEKETACAEQRMKIQALIKKIDDSWKTRLVVKAMHHAHHKSDTEDTSHEVKNSLHHIAKETACPEEKEKIHSFIAKEETEGEEWFGSAMRIGQTLWNNRGVIGGIAGDVAGAAKNVYG